MLSACEYAVHIECDQIQYSTITWNIGKNIFLLSCPHGLQAQKNHPALQV